jgi:hypothetical protein
VGIGIGVYTITDRTQWKHGARGVLTGSACTPGIAVHIPFGVWLYCACKQGPCDGAISCSGGPYKMSVNRCANPESWHVCASEEEEEEEEMIPAA